jgi:predicted PP-loop superfamily ATPase
MRICVNCVLPENFPGVRFSGDGVCNHCLEFKGEKDLEEKKLRYREKFEKLVKELQGRGGYDALMSYSGGKDSTFTLALIREKYGLNTLAVTVDNGFLPEQTIRNIRLVSEKLGFDHILYKPRFDVLNRIFSACSERDIYPQQTLVRASTICTSCMAIVKSITLRLALEKGIPFIVFGWSPGQIPLASSIMKNNSQMIRMTQKAVFDPLHSVAGEEIRPYFLEERHFAGGFNFPYNISPLAFFDYDEGKILDKASELGWSAPRDVDANSTNCQLNSLANVVHKKRHGFHPYAFEMAKLVREGYLSREEALEKLNRLEPEETVRRVKEKLGL